MISGPHNYTTIKRKLCKWELINKLAGKHHQRHLLNGLPTVKTPILKSLSLHMVIVGEVFSCSSTTVQALMLAPMHIMQISPKQSSKPSQQPIPPLTLQRQQRVDRSSQSCQGCLCQTQPIVRVPYSLMRRCYTADLMGGKERHRCIYRRMYVQIKHPSLK